MSVPASFHADLRDLLFADWAEVVTFREVSTAYEPADAQVSESHADSLLLAILGPGLNAPLPDTAHQHTTLTRTFLVRAEDLPAHASLTSSRILHGDDEYAILTADLAPGANILALSTTRLHPASTE